MKLLRVAYPFWPLWFICAITQLSGRIFTVIALLLEEITHLIHKFSFPSALPLASNPISVSLKVNYFFVSLSFQQRDGPFSVSMGSGPSCCSCSLLAASRLSHPSLLLMKFIFLCLTCFILCLFFRLDLLISLSLSPFFFQFSLFCSSGFGSKGNKASLKWFTYSLFRFPYSSLPLPGRSGKFWPWVIVQTGTFVVATEMILQLIKWSRNDREKRRNLTVPSQLKLRE